MSAQLIGDAIQDNPAFLALRKIEVRSPLLVKSDWNFCLETIIQGSGLLSFLTIAGFPFPVGCYTRPIPVMTGATLGGP